MAVVIVSNCVWARVYEYYENVEGKYPNTWDISDTVEQINKIRLVINDFEHISAWSRGPLIPHWKQMGWKETWDKKYYEEQENQNQAHRVTTPSDN